MSFDERKNTECARAAHQAWIEGSMGKRRSPVFYIVEQVVGDFKDTLAHYVLMGSK